jgi:hypothetical protein
MPAWPATNVVMLGKLRPSQRRVDSPAYMPSPTIDYMPTNVTPIPGQNVLQQVVMNGVRGVRAGVGGLGAMSSDEGLDAANETNRRTMLMAWGGVSMLSGVLSLYHGYKRNNSLGWGLGWYFMGVMFPLVTPTVAVAQGFGKRKGR